MTDDIFELATAIATTVSSGNYQGRHQLPETCQATIGDLVDHLWRDLMRAGSLWSNIRLIHKGRDLHPSAFMAGRIGDGMIVHSYPDAAKISQYLADDATLIYNHINETSPAVQRIQETLEYQLDARVWIQAYLTRAGESAFGSHVDDHNFIVLQLFGCKSWHINFHGSNSDSVMLTAGELIAVPSETPHCVSGCGTLSLHLTIAFQWLEGTRAGSVIPLSDLEAHRSAARIGSSIPLSLHDDITAFRLRFKFRDRVKPKVFQEDRGVRIECAGGRVLVDHCFDDVVTQLARGKELTRAEMLETCPHLDEKDLDKFLRFGVNTQILHCSG